MGRTRGKKPPQPKTSPEAGPHGAPGPRSSSIFEFKDRSGKTHRVEGKATKPLPRTASLGNTAAPGPKTSRPGHRPVGKFGPRGPRPRPSEFDPAPTPQSPRPRNPKNYGPTETPIRLRGVIDKNKKGFGFISFDNRRIEDAFVPPREADQFFHGDRVEVAVNGAGEILDLKVIAHRFREIVGRYRPEPRQSRGVIVYERKNVREEIIVPGGSTQAKSGDWVKAALVFDEESQLKVTAKITEVYGPELPSEADIGMVAAEHNLIEEHSAAAVAQAEGYQLNVDEELKKGRIDLRELPLITIDGETARDFDDAVFVERKADRFFLWVGIADVSHYVTEASPLDQEALSRGTSVYFPERAFHMLPRALSENLCSLVPHQPRLVLVSKIEFDSHGKRVGIEVMEAVMHSKRRATYN